MEPPESDRVVLADDRATARVRIAGAWHEGVAIVALRPHDDARRVADALREDAVLLQEQAATAFARIAGSVHAGLPIFKDDARVRVREIKERSAKM